MSIQGLLRNMCLDVNYQPSWDTLIMFLFELENTTLFQFTYFCNIEPTFTNVETLSGNVDWLP